METVYVVRELVTAASGEKEIRTHYEYGSFPTYKAADECATATRNQSCFPQRDELAYFALDAPARWCSGIGSAPRQELTGLTQAVPCSLT
jgi:hypothetical protein